MHALFGARLYDRTFPQSIDRLAWVVRHVAHRLCADRERRPCRSIREYADHTDLLGRRAVRHRRPRACGPFRCVRILRSARRSHAGAAARDTATAHGRKLRHRSLQLRLRTSLETYAGQYAPGFTALHLKRLFRAR